jgi:hypothetical protein
MCGTIATLVDDGNVPKSPFGVSAVTSSSCALPPASCIALVKARQEYAGTATRLPPTFNASSAR